MKHYPLLTKHVNMFQADKGKNLPNWPSWCFLPMASWYSIVSHRFNLDELSLAEIAEVAPAAAFEDFPRDVALRGFTPERHLLENALAALG